MWFDGIVTIYAHSCEDHPGGERKSHQDRLGIHSFPMISSTDLVSDFKMSTSLLTFIFLSPDDTIPNAGISVLILG